MHAGRTDSIQDLDCERHGRIFDKNIPAVVTLHSRNRIKDVHMLHAKM